MDGFDTAFEHVAALARSVVPEATLGVSQGAKHLSLVPFSPPAIDAVRGDLEGFAASRGVIRFTPEHPVPDAVILRLIRLRLAEIRP